jgi:hypothetical protein
MNIGQAEYVEAKTLLGTEFLTIPNVDNLWTRRRFISSKDDFVKAAGVATGQKREIRFIEMSRLRFVDSEVEGFDDCPVKIIGINLLVFHEFIDSRPDGSNSADDFAGVVLELSKFVLENRQFELPSGKVIQLSPIVEPNNEQFGNEQLTDCKGHFTNLTFEVSFYDEDPTN